MWNLADDLGMERNIKVKVKDKGSGFI